MKKNPSDALGDEADREKTERENMLVSLIVLSTVDFSSPFFSSFLT